MGFLGKVFKGFWEWRVLGEGDVDGMDRGELRGLFVFLEFWDLKN